MSDNIGAYEERTFPAHRIPTLDTLDVGKKKHHIPVLLEVDVTEAREQLRAAKAKTGERISFTGWVLACIGHAANEHKHVHAMRKGRSKLIVFDDVDVSIVVERSVPTDGDPSRTLPMPYVVRKCNEKSVKQINDEIRAAQGATLDAGEVQLASGRSAWMTQAFTQLPRRLRYLLVWRRLTKDPFFAKKMMGTVVVTSIGSAGSFHGYGWAIPSGLQPLAFALGNIASKPAILDGEVAVREYLSMTVLFDHDVTDGAPVFRFVQRLTELMEQGHGLDQL